MTDLSIPDFLKIDPDTRREAWRGVKVKTVKEPRHDYTNLITAHRLRKLRAEERRLSQMIDDLGNRDNAARRKLYDAIKIVEQQIDAIHPTR